MKKMMKIVIYFLGICLVVGAGIWAELNSGSYPSLERKDGSVKVQDVMTN